MNRLFSFLGVFLLLFVVFACKMPSELEVTGSPSLKFAANMNFNEYFSDMIDDALNKDGDTQTIPCTNPSLNYKVLLLRMEIFRKENYMCSVDESSFSGDTGTITINGEEIPVTKNDTEHKYFVLTNSKTIASSSEPHVRTFKGLDDYFEGFEFIGIKSKLYIYGTDLANVVNIDLDKVDDEGNETVFVEDHDVDKGSSNTEFIEEYTGLGLPPGGADVDIEDIINSGGDLLLNYKIYIPAGREIEFDWIDVPQTIIAELVIWLPMTLESVEENAHVKFPSFFNGIGDIIKSLSGTGCIETMTINLTITPSNPFSNGIFVISDEAYGNISSPLDINSFNINLNQDEIDYINKNPFDPRFFILFPVKNSLLKIQNGDILLSTVSLDAKLYYNMGL